MFGGGLYSAKRTERELGRDGKGVAVQRRQGALKTAFTIQSNRATPMHFASEVATIKAQLADRLSLYAAGQRLRLPAYAIEQIVAKGLLEFLDHPFIWCSYSSQEVSAQSLEKLVGSLAEVEVPLHSGVPLTEAVRGIGGGLKPWGEIVSLLLTRKIPFFSQGNPEAVGGFTIPVVAIDCIQRLPTVGAMVTEKPVYLSMIAVKEILNLQIRGDLSIKLMKENQGRGPTMDRILALSRRFITRGEIARKIGRSARWVKYAGVRQGLTKNSPFGYLREAGEDFIRGNTHR